MYCPKCGDVLVESSRGQLECARGKMPISKHLEGELRRAYPESALTPAASLGERPSGIGFAYCPGCGEKLTPSLDCPECGRSLWTWRFHLVELHPHWDDATKDWT
jgi:uncharacterized OB-fold protein